MRGKEARDDFFGIDDPADFFLNFESDSWFEEVEAATIEDEKVLATVTFDDEILESVAVQFKGPRLLHAQ